MKPFDRHTGVAAALLKPSIDTDAIIPSREIKTVGKDGLAEGLFANWRYRDVAAREPDPEFVLNWPNGAFEPLWRPALVPFSLRTAFAMASCPWCCQSHR